MSDRWSASWNYSTGRHRCSHPAQHRPTPLIMRAMGASGVRWAAEPRFNPHKGLLEAYLE